MMASRWKPPLNEPKLSRPFVIMVFDDPDVYARMRRDLSKDFGKSDYETPAFSVDGLESQYGGAGRSKMRIISFARPVSPEEIVDMRKKTMAAEARYQHGNRPLIEVDPGYIGDYTAVRTSLEEGYHRIYFYHGIYAENLYYFEGGSFRPFEHTPPFFRQKEVLTVFNDLHTIREVSQSK